MRNPLAPAFLFLALIASTGSGQSKATYADDVRPIFEARCIRCHNADRESGGLALDDFNRVMAGGSSGEVVSAGDADSSKLIRVILHEDTPTMPPGGKLDAAAIATVRRWIDGGALENRSSKAKRKPKRSNPAFDTAATGSNAGPAPALPALSLEPAIRAPRANPIVSLAANPRAPIVAVASYRQVLVYDSGTLDLLGVLPYPEGTPHAIVFSRDGRLLVAGGGHGSARGGVAIWSVATGQRIFDLWREPDAVLAVDLSPDGTRLVVGGPSKTAKLYATDDSRLVHRLRGATDWVTAVRFSPDGRLVAGGDRAGNVFVWETETGEEYVTPDPHRGRITAIDWQPDGAAFATASEDGSVVIWRTKDAGRIRRWTAHNGGVSALRWHAKGRIATAGRDRLAKSWRANGRAIRSYKGPKDIALCAAIADDGAGILAGDWRGCLHRWAVDDGKGHRVVTAHVDPIAPRVQRLERDVAAAEITLRDATRALKSASALAEAAEAGVNSLQRVRMDAERAWRSAETELAAAESAYKAARATYDADPDDLDRVRAVHIGLGRRYRARRAAETARPTLDLATTRHEDSRLAHRVAKTRLNQDRNAWRTATATLDRLTRELDRWRAEAVLADASTRHDAARATRIAAERAAREAELELERGRAESDRLIDERSALETRAETAERVVPALERRSERVARLHAQSDAQWKLAESRHTFANEVLRLAVAIRGTDAALRERVQELPATVAGVARAGETLNDVVVRLEAEAKDAQAAVDRLAAITRTTSAAKHASLDAIAAIRRDMADLAKRVATVGDAWQDAEIAIAAADERVDDATRALTAAIEAYRRASDSLSAARERAQAARTNAERTELIASR